MHQQSIRALGSLVLVVAIALLSVAFRGAAVDEVATATATLPPRATSTPLVTPTLTPSAASTVAARSLEESAEAFAGALVSGNLVALMTSFSPAGLSQAMALAGTSGTNGTDVVSDARVASIGEPSVPAETRSVVFEVTAPAGQSEIVTEWGLQPGGAWQIVSLLVTPG